MTIDSLRSLRSICHALPEVEERLSHGEPSWFITGKKLFVTYADHHHDDRLAFWCAAPEGLQHMLVEADPEQFFVPPYVGGRGWLGVYLDVKTDWSRINELIVEAYLTVAPKRLATGRARLNLTGRRTSSPPDRASRSSARPPFRLPHA